MLFATLCTLINSGVIKTRDFKTKIRRLNKKLAKVRLEIKTLVSRTNGKMVNGSLIL